MSGALCSPTAYLLVLVFCALSFALYLAIGLPIARELRERGWIPSELYVLAAIGATALIAYGLFWAWLWKPAVGRLTTILVLILTVIALLEPELRARFVSALREPDVRWPIVLTLLIGALYIGVTYAVAPADRCAATNRDQVRDRVIGSGSPDYLIQKFWADGLARGNPPWNYVLDPDVASTTVADRPPLLGSMSLLLYPVTPERLWLLCFMAATAAASLAWVAALWGLLRAAGLSVAPAAAGVIAASQTHYFWYSSVFTWPKALSGAFLAGAVVLLVIRPLLDPDARRTTTALTGAGFAALAMLAHFSAALMILIIALMLLHPRFFPGWRAAAGGLFLFVVLTGSYVHVKSVNEPRVSALTRYTLSVPDNVGVEPVESKKLSTAEAIRHAYSGITLAEVVSNKLYNVAPIVNFGCFLACDRSSVKESVAHSEFYPIAGSMKILNVGWLLFVVPLVLRLMPHRIADRASKALQAPANVRAATAACAAIALLGLLFYALAIFRQPVNNYVSSAFMLLLFAAVIARLMLLPRRWATLAVAAPAAYFAALVLLLTREESAWVANPPLIATSVVAALLLGWVAVRALRGTLAGAAA